jgi:CheY-like chemotaxis protein
VFANLITHGVIRRHFAAWKLLLLLILRCWVTVHNEECAMSRRILIAEDERPIRELLQTLLVDEGYQVTTVRDGREGLEALAHEPYDLVLSNVAMPRLDGRELASAMHADPTLRTIPIILMSAAGATLLQGVPHAAFVPKPFDLGNILAVVEQVLTVTVEQAAG